MPLTYPELERVIKNYAHLQNGLVFDPVITEQVPNDMDDSLERVVKSYYGQNAATREHERLSRLRNSLRFQLGLFEDSQGFGYAIQCRRDLAKADELIEQAARLHSSCREILAELDIPELLPLQQVREKS